MTTTITRRFDRLDANEKILCNTAIRNLTQHADINNFGCIYVIERAGDEAYRKVGVSDMVNLTARNTKIALGDPAPHRVASLCLFYDREIAGYVEAALKRDYRQQGLHSQGGTEWYDASREKIVFDVHRLAHELMLQRLLTDRSSGTVTPIHKTLHGFFGLCIFHVVKGEIFPQEFKSEILDSAYGPDDSVEKRGVWTHLVSFLQSFRS